MEQGTLSPPPDSPTPSVRSFFDTDADFQRARVLASVVVVEALIETTGTSIEPWTVRMSRTLRAMREHGAEFDEAWKLALAADPPPAGWKPGGGKGEVTLYAFFRTACREAYGP